MDNIAPQQLLSRQNGGYAEYGDIGEGAAGKVGCGWREGCILLEFFAEISFLIRADARLELVGNLFVRLVSVVISRENKSI